MTGRAMGYCAGYVTAGFETAPRGGLVRGLGPVGGWFRAHGGRGRAGFGPGYRGIGFGWGAAYGRGMAAGRGMARAAGSGTPESRGTMLREEIDLLSSRLKTLQRELDNGAGDKSASSEDE
jgi:uncharacterized protein DUF5320